MLDIKIRSLNDLFREELGDLYSLELQLTAALPRLMRAASSDEMKFVLGEHVHKAKLHTAQLEKVFKELGYEPYQVMSQAMRGLIAEGEELVRKTERCAARDAAIIGAIQRVGHYEIAAYGTAQSHAALLGYGYVQGILQEILEEERLADQQLSILAEGYINVQAHSVLEDQEEKGIELGTGR